LLNDHPRQFWPERNVQLARKNVYRAERQHSEARLLEPARYVPQSVEHLVYRAVTACRDNGLKTFGYRLSRQSPRIARPAGKLERALGSHFVEVPTKPPGLFTFGRGVENDACTHASLFVAGDADSRAESAMCCDKVNQHPHSEICTPHFPTLPSPLKTRGVPAEERPKAVYYEYNNNNAALNLISFWAQHCSS